MLFTRSGEALVLKFGSEVILGDSTNLLVSELLATIPDPLPSRLALDVSEVERVTDTCFWVVAAIALLQIRSRRRDIALAYIGPREAVDKSVHSNMERFMSIYSDLDVALADQANWKVESKDPVPCAVPPQSRTVKRCPTCGQRV